ncbi:MAG TPA: zinc ABC transporter substrate-binding protein [Candidatus Tenderia electrophaga]|uniref:High-affinity zinc uptake system protein ZnuA n=1 Tax=Candidatus Tenderia electrophaga TaxID=1748243 RepID=A0A832J7W0_9GAMM|nr:zinc ABC transporter substrate-binding protein [Candidatus Tenderia electrophaga]
MFRYIIAFTLCVLFATTSHASAAPRVVVSIAPIHSLVAGVMDGVAEPVLLVRGNSSPHGYRLKPSQARSLQRADLIVWVGESMEGFLVRPLANLDSSKMVVELMNAPGMQLLDGREGGVWRADQKDHGHDNHDRGKTDAHLWLDPENALTIVRLVAARLSALDAGNAVTYKANGKRLQKKLLALDKQLKQTLAAVKQTPYLVFHDAYQYFEQRYGLLAIGAIMSGAENKPGARRLTQIRQRVKTAKARCVFSEPQFPSKLIQIVTEGTNLKSATLDPMGMGLEPGETLYFELMHKLGQDLLGCLEA